MAEEVIGIYRNIRVLVLRENTVIEPIAQICANLEISHEVRACAASSALGEPLAQLLPSVLEVGFPDHRLGHPSPSQPLYKISRHIFNKRRRRKE